MLIEKKYFTGFLDADAVDTLLSPDAYVNAENIRWGTTDNGVTGTMESVGSNTIIFSNLGDGINSCIGATVDEVRRWVVWFNFNSNGSHGIWAYDIPNNVTYQVLTDNNVTGGMGLSYNSPIHSCRIVNGILYWVDSTNNEPRAISMDAAIKMNDPDYVTDAVPYVGPLPFSEITLIKPPPPLAPTIEKAEDVSFENNFIANESFRFVYQYIYYTNEETVVGTYSVGSRLNKVTDDYNYITVSMDPLEFIPNSVRFVNLIVRIGDTAFIIKTWDKEVTAEAAEIEDQNDGTQVLVYDFYNDITGQALSDNMVLKPFDSVPIYSETLETAKNRLIVGNNTEGYDTPLTTSLTFSTLSVSPEDGSTVDKALIEVSISYLFPSPKGYSAYYVYMTEVSPIGYYEITSTVQTNNSFVPPPLGVPPTSEAFSGLTFRGANQSDVTAYVKASLGSVGVPVSNDFIVTTNMVTITGLSVSTFDVFKSRSQYNLGVVFYDFAMRKCGVIPMPSNPVSIPARNYPYSSGIANIVWQLSNTNALEEIPDWAYYYTIVRTLNLTTRYFIDGFSDAVKYATKDADGEYVFTGTTFSSNTVAVALDTTALVQAGLGYVFAQGDVCYLIAGTNATYTLPVIGQVGKYILVAPTDIGDTTSEIFIYEIYTPYQTSAQEFYYEVGSMYRILNPGTDSRTYETLLDLMDADAYALTRNYAGDTYIAEAMSPNDLFYNRWDNDTGKVNLITKLGQQQKTQAFSFSNTFIPGTAVNGLSTFEPLNQSAVPQECGPLNKLQLTSKVSEEGSVLLAICQNETCSIYLGETRVQDETGITQLLATTTNFIGTINVLKGSFGTITPTSVCEYRGKVFWLDLLSGKYIQYSSNGLFPISNYKMTRFWKLFCDAYLATFTDGVPANPYVVSTVDPRHEELLVSIPQVLSVPPKGYLPDFPSEVYPFDIFDGQAKTLVYKLAGEPNKWQGAYTFQAQYLTTVQDTLFSFCGDQSFGLLGALYRHNETSSYCMFYEVQYKSRLMHLCNLEPGEPKVYFNLHVRANLIPTRTYFRSEDPYVQASDLADYDYKNIEGVFYSPIYRNKLVPTATGLDLDGLLTAEPIRTDVLRVLLEWTVTSTPLELRFISFGYQMSRGHLK